MATNGQMSDHVSKVRAAATALLDAQNKLDELRRDWDYIGLGDALPVDLAGVGHPGLSRDDIAAVYTSAAAIRSLLDAGHGTNLTKARTG